MADTMSMRVKLPTFPGLGLGARQRAGTQQSRVQKILASDKRDTRLTDRQGMPWLRMRDGYRPGVVRENPLSATVVESLEFPPLYHVQAWQLRGLSKLLREGQVRRDLRWIDNPQFHTGQYCARGMRVALFGEAIGDGGLVVAGERSIALGVAHFGHARPFVQELVRELQSPYCDEIKLAAWRQVDVRGVGRRRLRGAAQLFQDLGYWRWHAGRIDDAAIMMRVSQELFVAMAKQLPEETPTAFRREALHAIVDVHECLGDLAVERSQWDAAEKYYRTARGTVQGTDDALQIVSLYEQRDFMEWSLIAPGALGALGNRQVERKLEHQRMMAQGERIAAKEAVARHFMSS